MSTTLAHPRAPTEQMAIRPAQQAVELWTSPWLTAQEAADYLRCPISRIRKLTSEDRIPYHREGRRVLYHRDELDQFVLAGGAYAS